MKAGDESLATERHRGPPRRSSSPPGVDLLLLVADYPSILFLGLELQSLASSMLGASMEVPSRFRERCNNLEFLAAAEGWPAPSV